MATFRNQPARDRAWARHYARQGLRGVVEREARSMPNAYRLANYTLARAAHAARVAVCSSLVKC